MIGTGPQDLPEWVMVRCPDCGARFVRHQLWPRFRGRLVNFNEKARRAPEGYMDVDWIDECPAEQVCQELIVAALQMIVHSDPADDRVQCCDDMNR